MNRSINMKYYVSALLGLQALAALASLDVKSAGLAGDGVTDDTPHLAALLAEGKRDLFFSAGKYRLGTVVLPSDTTLSFAREARILVVTNGITELDDHVRPLFQLKGNRIRIDGLDAAGVADTLVRRGKSDLPVLSTVFYAEGCDDIKFMNLKIGTDGSRRRDKFSPQPVKIVNCRNIEGCGCEFTGMTFCFEILDSVNASIHGNRAFDCNTITTFGRGSEGLRHYDNWSRNVVYQCVFRGGSPDPSRKSPGCPLGTSKFVIRDLDRANTESSYYKAELAKIGAEGVVLDPSTTAKEWYTHLSGTYDIQIVNNYAEYGRTLAWGNKGREVIFAGNVSRFMTDYSYGVEGCENVVFANNISINARSVGIMSMYWGDKLVLSGNMVIVRDEPYKQEYSWMKDQSGYWGGLFRFHHGPGNKADYEAGSDYGGGNAIVSGNLFINELTDRVRSVLLESGRDVTITGNKFVNAVIRKVGQGTVTITGNEFVSYMPVEHTCVTVGGNEMTVADNIMRYVGGGKRMVLKEVAADGTDEAQDATEEEKLTEKLPAISMNFRKYANFRRLIVKGNTMTGWTADAVRLDCPPIPAGTAKTDVLFRDNNIEGAVRVVGTEMDVRLLSFGNVDLHSFAQLKIVQEAPQPVPAKK